MPDVIEGRHPVLEALKSGRPMNRILLAKNLGRHSTIGEILQLARERRIPVEYVPRDALDRAGSTPQHQGVVAYVAAHDYVSLNDLLAVSDERREAPLYCILDGIEDPQNLGAILRCAETSGTHGVVVRSRRAVGLTASVARASAGAIEYIPVARVTNIAQTVSDLKERGVWTTGVDPIGETVYTEADFTVPTAIVIGAEGKGLSHLVRQRCDFLVSIPMRGRITSLNASIAAALVMYEVLRQRNR